MGRSTIAALAAALGLALAGCSGMNGSSMTPGVPSAPSAQSPQAAPPALGPDDPQEAASDNEPPAEALAAAQAPAEPAAKNPANANAIDAVNALGSPVKTYGDETTSEPGSNSRSKHDLEPARPGPHIGKSACHAGIEFFSPDRANDPNSTEVLNFYDGRCSQLARDAVRKWTAGSTPGTETVTRTVTDYAQGGATAISTRTERTTFTNGTFGRYGFPVVADGFQRETSSTLVVGTRKNVLSDSETVMAKTTTSVSGYCTDSAGYNSVGIAKLNLAFGWNGGAFGGGTRTLNPDLSVTWSATHSGQTESAPIGALSIASGTPNASCPIATPAYVLSGGTAKGSYTIPIAVTYKFGVIRRLTVTNATLSSGYTLNVATNARKWPANPAFINGTVTSGSATVAVFNVNAFGNGTLTVAATGNQFPITDWNVVR
jgi:hypothetical protein